MNSTYHSLVECLRQRWAEKQCEGDNVRLLVALAGPPGSGKTTVAHQVAKHVSTSLDAPWIVILSTDGFHYPLSTLRSWPHAGEALARRGAPWTFDEAAVVALVRNLRRNDEVVIHPMFDHAIKDSR
ncbi:hypothetical protein FOCG_16600 [Fusarium oxysporum f. sp. radicis-lycopersici 26381]|nr:hypothetical protein FOCG_16600 [Fusarium oxysporum f. sp. radicis-lycopersici 26381]